MCVKVLYQFDMIETKFTLSQWLLCDSYRFKFCTILSAKISHRRLRRDVLGQCLYTSRLYSKSFRENNNIYFLFSVLGDKTRRLLLPLASFQSWTKSVEQSVPAQSFLNLTCFPGRSVKKKILPSYIWQNIHSYL